MGKKTINMEEIKVWYYKEGTRNNYGDISNIESKAENHFILMLRHFYSLISDCKKAQIEKEHILNLSRITEEIKIS